MLSTLSSKVLVPMNKAVYKYCFNYFSKVNLFTSLVFVYHVWLLAIFIFFKMTSKKIINKKVIFIRPL